MKMNAMILAICGGATLALGCSGQDIGETETGPTAEATEPVVLVDLQLSASSKLSMIELAPGHVNTSVVGSIDDDASLQDSLGQLAGSEGLLELYTRIVPPALRDAEHIGRLETAEQRIAANAGAVNEAPQPEPVNETMVEKEIETIFDSANGRWLCLRKNFSNEWESIVLNVRASTTFGWFGDTTLYQGAALNLGGAGKVRHEMLQWTNERDCPACNMLWKWRLKGSTDLFARQWQWRASTYYATHTRVVNADTNYDTCAFWRFK
jgi:hypothetical protein